MRTIILFILCALAGGLLMAQEAEAPAEAPPATEAAEDEEIEYDSIEIILEEGRFLTVGALVEGLFKKFDMEVPADMVKTPGRLDVSGIRGFIAVKTINLAMGNSMEAQLLTDRLAIRYRREDVIIIKEKIRKQLARIVLRIFQDKDTNFEAENKSKYGLFPGNIHKEEREALILVHGVDADPSVFRNTVKAFDRFANIYLFKYRNDQAIAQSAKDFSEAVSDLPAESVYVCTTSMGALVLREYLGTPELYRKKVSRLLMLCPPNHGSNFAKLREVLELAEAFRKLAADEAGFKQVLLSLIEDGLGQAGDDLIPGSLFLDRLAKKPIPEGVRFGIIAGNLALLSGKQHEELVKWVDGKMDAIDNAIIKAAFGKMVREIRKADALINGKGDLVVSLESARLEGAEFFKIVARNHLTIRLGAPDSEVFKIMFDFFGMEWVPEPEPEPDPEMVPEEPEAEE